MVSESRPSRRRRKAQPGALLAWYDVHARDLPWRVRGGLRPDPYRVWLSEIMLQQTTVAAVVPYFTSFTARWPTVQALASADEREVMAAWAGLGYYSRARNLIACARAVAADGGRFPEHPDALRTLPGIGPYTAGAIAAIAFGRPEPAVDGNVERVISRFFAIETPFPAAKAEVAARVRALIPADRPGDFAQALMDLGATVCTPRSPACGRCPWQETCEGRRRGLATILPLKSPKAETPLRRGVAFVATSGGHVLLRRRPPKGLLGGMMEPPQSPWEAEAPASPLAHAPFAAQWAKVAGAVRHGFTHFRLEVDVFRAETARRNVPGGEWTPLSHLDEAGLPTVMRKMVRHALGDPALKSSRASRSAAGRAAHR